MEIKVSKSLGRQDCVGYSQDLRLYPERNQKPLRALKEGIQDQICILGSTPWLLEENIVGGKGGGGGTREKATDVIEQKPVTWMQLPL